MSTVDTPPPLDLPSDHGADTDAVGEFAAAAAGGGGGGTAAAGEDRADMIAIVKGTLDQLAQEANELIVLFKKHVATESAAAPNSSPVRTGTISGSVGASGGTAASRAQKAAELANQRSITNTALASQWTIISTTTALLVQTVASEVEFDLDQHCAPIEKILAALVSNHGLYKDHEFHFPFFVLRLMGALKSTVKAYADITSPDKAGSIEQVHIAPPSRVVAKSGGPATKPPSLGVHTQPHVARGGIHSNNAQSGSPANVTASATSAVFSTPSSAAMPSATVPSPADAESATHASASPAQSGVKVKVRDAAKHFERIEADIATSASKMKRRPDHKPGSVGSATTFSAVGSPGFPTSATGSPGHSQSQFHTPDQESPASADSVGGQSGSSGHVKEESSLRSKPTLVHRTGTVRNQIQKPVQQPPPQQNMNRLPSATEESEVVAPEPASAAAQSDATNMPSSARTVPQLVRLPAGRVPLPDASVPAPTVAPRLSNTTSEAPVLAPKDPAQTHSRQSSGLEAGVRTSVSVPAVIRVPARPLSVAPTLPTSASASASASAPAPAPVLAAAIAPSATAPSSSRSSSLAMPAPVLRPASTSISKPAPVLPPAAAQAAASVPTRTDQEADDHEIVDDADGAAPLGRHSTLKRDTTRADKPKTGPTAKPAAFHNPSLDIAEGSHQHSPSVDSMSCTKDRMELEVLERGVQQSLDELRAIATVSDAHMTCALSHATQPDRNMQFSPTTATREPPPVMAAWSASPSTPTPLPSESYAMSDLTAKLVQKYTTQHSGQQQQQQDQSRQGGIDDDSGIDYEAYMDSEMNSFMYESRRNTYARDQQHQQPVSVQTRLQMAMRDNETPSAIAQPPLWRDNSDHPEDSDQHQPLSPSHAFTNPRVALKRQQRQSRFMDPDFDITNVDFGTEESRMELSLMQQELNEMLSSISTEPPDISFDMDAALLFLDPRNADHKTSAESLQQARQTKPSDANQAKPEPIRHDLHVDIPRTANADPADADSAVSSATSAKPAVNKSTKPKRGASSSQGSAVDAALSPTSQIAQLKQASQQLAKQRQSMRQSMMLGDITGMNSIVAAFSSQLSSTQPDGSPTRLGLGLPALPEKDAAAKTSAKPSQLASTVSSVMEESDTVDQLAMARGSQQTGNSKAVSVEKLNKSQNGYSTKSGSTRSSFSQAPPPPPPPPPAAVSPATPGPPAQQAGVRVLTRLGAGPRRTSSNGPESPRSLMAAASDSTRQVLMSEIRSAPSILPLKKPTAAKKLAADSALARSKTIRAPDDDSGHSEPPPPVPTKQSKPDHHNRQSSQQAATVQPHLHHMTADVRESNLSTASGKAPTLASMGSGNEDGSMQIFTDVEIKRFSERFSKLAETSMSFGTPLLRQLNDILSPEKSESDALAAIDSLLGRPADGFLDSQSHGQVESLSHAGAADGAPVLPDLRLGTPIHTSVARASAMILDPTAKAALSSSGLGDGPSSTQPVHDSGVVSETQEPDAAPASPTSTSQPTNAYDPRDEPGHFKNVVKYPSSIPIFSAKPNITRLLLIPLNAMMDTCLFDMTTSVRFGRNNTTAHPCFKAFTTLVVSRNHMEIFERDGKVYIRDVSSNSGTFRNNARLSPPGTTSPDVELHTGDYVQLGKDYVGDGAEMDEDGRIQPRRRCVQFQVVIIQPGQSSAQAVESQDIPIEEPVPKSRGRHGRNPSSVDQSVISDAPEGGTHVRDNTASANESASGTAGMPGKAGGELSKKFKTDASLQSKAAAESFAGPENTTSLVGYDDGYGQEQSEQQQPQQQRQQEQQQPLRESQPPANAAGVSGTLNLSGSNPSVSASAKPLPPVPGDPKPAAAAQDQAGKLARPVSRLFREKRETFVFASVVAGNKTKKIQVSSPQGTKLLDVNLKKWDDRSRIQVADLRPMSSMAGLMFEIGPIDKTGRPFVPVKGAHKLTDLTFSVSMIDNGGVNLGSLKFESDIKLIIAVDEPTNIEPHVSSPIQHISNTKLSASGHSTASIPDDAPVVALTGDFKSGRYILVKKMAKSREQRLFGECKGRHLARKTVLESHWLTSVDIDEADINPIVLSAVVLICMVPPA